ncbi:MAG TPA: hypothetical protein DEQ02_05205 [Ruminococcaceae bacterium]|nr:hypothetical protein [Oscillospiraceae bacterium]
MNRELSEVAEESPGQRKQPKATLDNSIARNRGRIAGAMGKARGLSEYKGWNSKEEAGKRPMRWSENRQSQQKE